MKVGDEVRVTRSQKYRGTTGIIVAVYKNEPAPIIVEFKELFLTDGFEPEEVEAV